MKVRVITNAAVLRRELRDLAAWAEAIDLVSAWASTNEGTAAHWTATPPLRPTWRWWSSDSMGSTGPQRASRSTWRTTTPGSSRGPTRTGCSLDPHTGGS